MNISIIIPTRNRVDSLRLTIDTILNNVNQDIELIVVDNGSDDDTAKLVKSMNQIKYIYEPEIGLHNARNVAIQETNGEIIAYLDDDIKITPTWLDGIVESFQDKQVGLVGGNSYPNWEAEPPNWVDQLWHSVVEGRFLSEYSLIDFHCETKEISPYYVFGQNFAIRRGLLIEIGGFHPDGMPSDRLRYRGDGETFVASEVAKKGYKVIFNPKASVYHHVPNNRMTMDYIYRRSYFEGIGHSYTRVREAGKINFIDLRFMLSFMKRCVRYLLASKIDKVRIKGFLDGYFYHQREVKNDPSLLEWVLQERY